MSISLCMIVRNDKQGALKAIKNVDKFVDEKIIVDTGSTDGTQEALTKAGCKVYDFEWCDDFSKPRNLALEKASCDWILVIDSDEKYDLKSLAEIKRLSGGPKNTGYIFTQRHYVLNQYLTNYNKCDGSYPLEEIGYPGYYFSCVCRLFPRHKDIYFTGRIHELVEPQMEKLGFKILEASPVIHHYGNVEHIRKRLKKAETYIRLLKKKSEEMPDWKVFYDIGLEYLTADINNPEEAEKYFTKSIEVQETEAAYSNRGLLYVKINRFDLAKQDFLNAQRVFPESSVAKTWLAELAKNGVK